MVVKDAARSIIFPISQAMPISSRSTDGTGATFIAAVEGESSGDPEQMEWVPETACFAVSRWRSSS